jgi:dTDP-4-amino-4,6-dideoxygalactose transaminase
VVEEDEFGADRQKVIDALKAEDIYTRKYFYPLTSDMDCYSGRFDSSLTPVAKRTADRVITLPMSASLNLDDVDRICRIIRSCKGR